jgi:cell division protein FtsL
LFIEENKKILIRVVIIFYVEAMFLGSRYYQVKRKVLNLKKNIDTMETEPSKNLLIIIFPKGLEVFL